MTVTEILNITDHRPWILPDENWKFNQKWNNAVFLHWQVDIDDLKKFVPEDIEIDLFEGKPWVSLVAFTMENVRPKNLPSISAISNFDEINIRTYGKYNNKTGVYFLSIEAGTKISCQIAKILSKLPYRYSKIKRHESRYHSFNTQYSDKFDMEFTVGQILRDKTELDKWLIERYALFQDYKDSISEFEIHYIEWSINMVDIKELKVVYLRFEQLLKKSPDLTHYSPGVQVIAWDK